MVFIKSDGFSLKTIKKPSHFRQMIFGMVLLNFSVKSFKFWSEIMNIIPFSSRCRYTLLVGRPPFETSCLKDTYMRIRNNEYAIPSRVSRPAAKLIQKLLSDRPEDRPSLIQVLQDDFFNRGYFPRSLPAVCCMAPPKFTSTSNSKYSKNSYANHKTNNSNYTNSKNKDKNHEGGINHIRTAISHLNFNGHSKDNSGKENNYLRKKCESAESGVESQDSNGHEIDDSFGE